MFDLEHKIKEQDDKNAEDLINKHWDFIDKLLEAFDKVVDKSHEFLFKEALKHGYKHGITDALEGSEDK